MSVFYLDPVGGNDANNGTSFAQRWKTVQLGATAARIAPGDVVRIMASETPASTGVNGTWTNLSANVTLSAALNTIIDDCEAQWTAAANVTTGNNGTRKQGTWSRQIVPAGAFGTGKLAHRDLGGAINLSSRQQVSFWFLSSTAQASGILELRLCSDTAGNVAVHSIPIPAMIAANTWQTVVWDNGSAMNSSIQSIALYAVADPGTPTYLIDNVVACNAPGATALTHDTMIGKPASSGAGSDPGDVQSRETWYHLQSIGTSTLVLGNGSLDQNTTRRGYFGTTETVALWKRETFKLGPLASGASSSFQVMDSGSAGNPIMFSGGWNRTDMSTQTDESWFDGVNCLGFGVNLTSVSYINIERVAVVRFATGVSISTGGACFFLNLNIVAANNCQVGVRSGLSAQVGSLQLVVGHANNNSDTGITVDRSAGPSSFHRGKHVSNNHSQAYFGSAARLQFDEAANNVHGVLTYGSLHIFNTVFSNNSTADYLAFSGANSHAMSYAYNTSFNSATEMSVSLGWTDHTLFSENHDGVSGARKVMTGEGFMEVDTSADARSVDSRDCWKATVNHVDRATSAYPLWAPVKRITFKANVLTTVSAYLKKSNSAITAGIRIQNGMIPGVTGDTAVEITGSEGVGAYVKKTMTFTPTKDGFADIQFYAYGGTTHTAWCDDVSSSTDDVRNLVGGGLIR